MDFELTEEMKMLSDMAYKFAQKELGPIARECDAQEKYDREVVRKAAENGLVAAWASEEYEGSGVGSLGVAVLTEQLARVDMGICTSIITASFGCEAIYAYGTEEQKQKYIAPVCRGNRSAPAPIRNRTPGPTWPDTGPGR